jgi:hypothetical protein
MKNFILPFLLALTTAMASAPATAAAVTLTLDLAPADFYFLPHADGSVEADAYPAFSPIAIASGDKLTVDVGFAGARAVLTDIRATLNRAPGTRHPVVLLGGNAETGLMSSSQRDFRT